MNNNNDIQGLTQDAISLLKQLIAIPSLSKEEDNTADLIEQFLQSKGVTAFRYLNNVWALLNDLLDVMIVEPRSYRREISWKNMLASSRSSLR